MSNAKFATLVRALFDQTRTSRIRWTTSVMEESFEVSFKSNSLRLSSVNRPRATSKDYIIYLIDQNGEIVYSVSDVDLDNGPESNEPGQFFSLMAELYIMARRSAMGADRVLNDILDELGEGD